MWALYLLSDTWLSGSLLLPFLLFARWSGSKWRGLHWLTGSRKRWLLIWGGYGLVKVITLAALLWVMYFPEFIGFEFLGWSAVAVGNALNALHIHSQSLSIEFLLGLSLKAIGEAAIDGGLAAIAWWVYSWLTQEPGTHRRMVAIERYAIGLLLSACSLGIANKLHFWRQVTCDDCFRPRGIPFTFFHEGGFAGGEAFVWRGVIGDSLVTIVLGFVLGLVWNKLAQKHSNLRTTSPDFSLEVHESIGLVVEKGRVLRHNCVV